MSAPFTPEQEKRIAEIVARVIVGVFTERENQTIAGVCRAAEWALQRELGLSVSLEFDRQPAPQQSGSLHE